MFSEDPNEQELYHATATVTSLLLEMGEVGKLFCSPSSREDEDEDDDEEEDRPLMHRRKQPRARGDSFHSSTEETQSKLSSTRPGSVAEGELNSCCITGPMEDIKLEDSSPKDNGTSSAMLISDDETKDDTSMSSYSVLSAGSHEMDDKLQCEDIADDTVLVRSGPHGRVGTHSGAGPHGAGGLPHSASIDKDWAITFEQFLASVLTEQALVQYFEKPVDITARITNAKNVRKVGQTQVSLSDYEISLSG